MKRTLLASITMTAALAFPLAASAQWSNPTTTPPNGNTSSPLNTSSSAQSKVAGLLLNTGGYTNGLIVQYGNTGIATTSPSARLSVTGSGTATSRAFVVANVNDAEKFTVLDNGNVGIGASSPITRAHVYGTLTVDAAGQSVNNYSEGIRLGQASNGYSIVTFGANASSASGSQANQWWIGKYGGDNGFNIWGNSPGDALHILPSGFVGIGTLTPSAKLSVGSGSQIQLVDNPSGWANYGQVPNIVINNTVDNPLTNSGWSYKQLSFMQLNGQEVWSMGWKSGGLRFDVNNGGSSPLFLSQAGNVGIGLTPSGTYKLEVNGSVGATSFFYTSDESLKKNITPLEGSLSKILKLRGVSFNWKSDGSKSVGLVAQDVEKVYPELVSTSKSGIKSVEYGNLVGPLIEAIKEQQKEIESLKAEVETLKNK